jgi:hypothetical protein
MAHNIALLRQQAAFERLRSAEDPALNQFLNRALFHVIKRFPDADTAPIADFDLLFFIDTMAEFFSNRDVLRRILDGEDLRVMDESNGIGS